jgi:hypothetical protein
VGTKLRYLPTSAELRRLRERWDREDAQDIPLKDFETTLASGIDDTVRHLKAFTQFAQPTVEQENLKLKALEELTAEIKSLREAHSLTVETLNRKAGKALLRDFEKTLTAKLDKRLDNLFKLVGFLGVAIGVLVAIKGH